ncbi:MAG: hypothetical protein ACREMU_11450, partial [Gemmatimonadaceae bacterium]
PATPYAERHDDAPIEAPPTGRRDAAPPATQCDDSARDIAVDLVKLFITFATAAIAFLVGAVFSGKIVLGTVTIAACLLLFAASVACGLLFFMNAVSELHTGDYLVTDQRPSILAAVQILFFLAGATWLGVVAIDRAGHPLPPTPITQIDIRASGGRWIVDSATGIGVHKDRPPRDSGAMLRLRTPNDGLTLRITVDTAARPPR